MLRYSIKRLFQSLFTLFAVVSITFLMLRLMPVEGYFTPGAYEKLDETAKLTILRNLGLYGPDGRPVNPLIQLGRYYKGLVTNLDFGVSTQLYRNQPVGTIVAERMPVSIRIGLFALVVSLLLGYALGILMARYKNGPPDSLGMGYIILVSAVPVMVIYFFVQFYVTKWIGSSMIYRAGDIKTYITPIVALSLVPIGRNALWVRRYMVDELNKDYVKLAYAKGLSSRAVMIKHVLRNAFIPMAYSLPAAVLGTLSGSLIMERLFSVPGMGRLFLDAISDRDNNFVQAMVIIYTAMGIFGVFLGDLLAVVVDPRIKLTKKGGTR